MSTITKYYPILIITLNLLIQSIAFAECCSQHGGICNKKKCCDDTPLPTDCGDFKFIKLPPIAFPMPLESQQPDKEPKQSVELPSQQLYSWHDPQTGTRYLSGTFPPWYRNSKYPTNYPPVLVYDDHNRLIDDTNQKIPEPVAQAQRKQAELSQQQQQAHQQAQVQELQAQTQQAILSRLLTQWTQQEQQWIATQKVTSNMTRLLEKLAKAKEVVIGMTEEQVKQAWGKPESESTAVVNGKNIKTLIYQNHRQIILHEGRVQTVTK